jgi:hypothetical protein
MLGKTVVEAALLDYLDRSLVDHLDGALLDHPDGSLVNYRAAAGDGSGPTPGGQVAPEQQRVQHGNQAGEQQDDPEGVDVDAGVVASTAKARMAPSTIRKMPTPMLIFHRPSRR